ncbi:hypothetical protein EJB05_31704, partial [Eragrostis curvula]
MGARELCEQFDQHVGIGLACWEVVRYRPDANLTALPWNCTVSVIPVLGYEGATEADYQRLMKRGFLLEYCADGCDACMETGGRCRIDDKDAFECHCSDGVYPVICGGPLRLDTPVCNVCWQKKHQKDDRNRIQVIYCLPQSANVVTLVSCAVCGVGGGLLVACFLLYLLLFKTTRISSKGHSLYFLLFKTTSIRDERNIEALISSYGSFAPKRYNYSEVTKITSSFNNKLGEGGYGEVFKGMLHDGRLVAVKFLHDSKANGEEFVNEVMSIGRTSHVNIVSLFGFCLKGSKRALIYEYMPNGSLDKYIYSNNPKAILGWERLYAIAVGIARGLEYLHHSCNTRIVHFDIKPQNILLDHNFCPKIADFGLAKLCHTKESKLSMTGARGTIGFIAPEVHSRTFGVVSTKSDVYSYGMMLLEMVGGRKNVKSVVEKSSQKYFPEWIYNHFAQDDGLQACEVTQEVEEIAKKMSLIGLWCVQILPMHRPTITKVLEMFERGSNELDMPPKQNFSQIMEDSPYNFNGESTSSNTTKAQAYSEVVKVKEISLVSSKMLQRLPTL